jgi:hypothetical protein
LSSTSSHNAAELRAGVLNPQAPSTQKGRTRLPPPKGRLEQRLHHPVVGDLELDYEVMELAADTGLRLAVFTAEPGSRSEEALNLLASWAATPAHEPAAPARDDVPRH